MSGPGSKPGSEPEETEPLDLPLDAHLHTDLSHDSDVPLDVYPALARARGVTEIAITDHLDFDAAMPNHRLGDHARRERLVRETAERWEGRPHIRFGVEISYQSRREDEIREYLATHAYDYTIGSVHIAPDDPVSDREKAARWCAGKTQREASAWYWDEVEAAIRSRLFDTLGHIDFVKRYLVEHLGPFRYEEHADIYDRLLSALVESGTALEVNSSGLRQQHAEMYPAPVVVERFRALGGERIVAGTDSHRRHSFGFALPDAYAAIEAAGFEQLSFRRGGARVDVALPGRSGGAA